MSRGSFAGNAAVLLLPLEARFSASVFLKEGLTMENKRPIQRRDFLKSATAASLLAGAAPLVVAEAAEPAKAADGTQNQAAAGGSIVGQEAADCVANLLRGMDNVRSLSVFEASQNEAETAGNRKRLLLRLQFEASPRGLGRG